MVRTHTKCYTAHPKIVIIITAKCSCSSSLSNSLKKDKSSSVLEEFPDVRHVVTWDVSVDTDYGTSSE